MENTIEITVIDREGTSFKLRAPTDMEMNVMEVCKSYELPVLGTCGGMAMCASCHCYVESDNVTLERSEAETAMLEETWYMEDNSRLGCQIHITPDLDGAVLRLAPGDDY